MVYKGQSCRLQRLSLKNREKQGRFLTSLIRDASLAPSGERKIDWVRRNMPVLRGIGEVFLKAASKMDWI